MSEGGANVPSMEAVAWSAIGLLGATLAILAGALLSLTSRIQSMGERMEGQGRTLADRIEQQGRSLSERIEADGRETRARIDALSSRMDQHIERHAG